MPIGGVKQNKDRIIPIGTVISVDKRTWSGINKPGRVGKVINYHKEEDSILYDVCYVLGGREYNIELKYVSMTEGTEMDLYSPCSSRQRQRCSLYFSVKRHSIN